MTFTSLGLPIIGQFKMYDSKKNILIKKNKETLITQFVNGAIIKYLEDFAAGLKPMEFQPLT